MARANYEAMRESAAARNREAAESGRDIGEIAAVADAARKARAAEDPEYFLKTYFAPSFQLEFCADHRTVIRKAVVAIREGGLFALAMPRGSGKTTICICLCIWAMLYGYRKFILLIGASEGHAVEMLDAIKSELESNALLAADFPEVCQAIAALEGIANRCKGQLHLGERTHVLWAKKTIVLPTIPGSPASACVLRVAGLLGRIRGMNFKRPDGEAVRPDLFVGDDPQTDRSAHSVNQCVRREKILAGAVLGLAGPGKKIAGLMPCTVIRAGDMADVILNREKHPEWNGERMKMLYKFPVNENLWHKYAEVRADGLQREKGLAPATEFYRANQVVLDEGAEVAWLQRFNHDEASAIQHAMNLKIQDEAAFFAEYQNAPLTEKSADSDLLTAEAISKKINNMKRYEIPIGCHHLTMFIDIQGTLLFHAVVAWADDFTGFAVDYGSYPRQNRQYYTLRDAQNTLQMASAGAGQEGAIYAGLEALVNEYLSKEFRRDDGGYMKIERCLIDANWGTSTDVVYQFCRQSPHAAVLLPSHGRFVGATSVPFHDYKKKTGDRVGHNWRIPNVQGKRAIRHVLFDVNYWKSFLHARLGVKLGDKGCLSLFGKEPSAHRMLADHLTAEYRVKVEARGRVVDEWKNRPENPDNHWLDCFVGCAVGASMQGAVLLGTDSKKAPARAKMSFSAMQAKARGRR